MLKIETLVDIKNILGENPLWDIEEERLYWVDSLAMNIYRCTYDGREVRAWELPKKIGSMALRRRGGAVLSLEQGFHFFDFNTEEIEFIVNPEPDKPDNRINDGKVDRQGRFLAGSMDTREREPAGSLYRLDTDLSVTKLDEGIIVSNGPCWSPDGSRFYFTDSYSREIRVYDYDVTSGAISNRRTFVKIASTTGATDGSTVDAEGGVWNAQVFDGKIVRYSPDGNVERVIDMPVKKVTSVMFGGPELDVLYVTSMGKQILPDFPPDGINRGALFAVHGLGVRGLPETRFGG